MTLSAADVSLPGRAGYNFTFGRVWNANQAMAFNLMSEDGSAILLYRTEGKARRLVLYGVAEP